MPDGNSLFVFCIGQFKSFNGDLFNIESPVRVNKLQLMLLWTGYNREETEHLVNGFTNGFSLEYEGPMEHTDRTNSLPFRDGLGSHEEIWTKMMKEVEARRLAGPFRTIPYKYYVQSPIGLVPKSNGQTRLIFHLSYDFKDSYKSINFYIPKEKCTVKYKDLDHAIEQCLTILQKFPEAKFYFGICDLKSAFRMIPLHSSCWALLIMKARDSSGNWQFFVDKCLPFRAAISCRIFQRFLNALAYLLKSMRSVRERAAFFGLSNYLDDFLHIALTEMLCNVMLKKFQQLCSDLGVPISLEKTVWATLSIVFLGILLDGERHILGIPSEKKDKAEQLLVHFLKKGKVTVKEIQRLAGLLNFLNKAIYPGRVFTRRMYAKTMVKVKGKPLKDHHHMRLDQEFKADCAVWMKFLMENPENSACFRLFIDLKGSVDATDISFYTDASANRTLGFGGVLGRNRWFFGKWGEQFMDECQPNIEYLELYAVSCGLWMWSEHFRNKRIVIHCDNTAVVAMINKTSSSCSRCMHLLRLLVS